MKGSDVPVASEDAGTNPSTRQAVIFVGLLATLLGAFVRLTPAIASGFPVNDGGLFYVFVKEIQATHFCLPTFSNYNRALIPFLYPPLSFYLTGLLSSLTKIPVLDLVRFLPPIISVATIPAFYRLARKLMKDELAAAAAVVSYALLPTAFDFMIVGGGLPRALGTLLCLLTLDQAAGFLSDRRQSRRVAMALFASLTALSHPVVAWFMVYSLAILLIFLGANRRALGSMLGAGAAVVLLTSPWWAVSLVRHGVAPWLAALEAGSRSWNALFAPFLFLHTNELYLTILAVFALLGVLACLHKRQFLLPAWLAAVFVLETRLTATYAAVPTAMLAGIGYAGVILPMLGVSRDRSATPGSDAGSSSPAMPARKASGRWVAMLATAYLLCYLVIAAFLAAPRDALPASQRHAMQWIRTNTPEASRFVVISGIGQAGIDYVSEWFPGLAERTSVATPQGYEWFPGQVFNRRWDLHADLQACGHQEASCLQAWADRAQSPYTHVYLVKAAPGSPAAEGTQDLYQSLLGSPDYEEIYSQEDVAVFSYRPAPALSHMRRSRLDT